MVDVAQTFAPAARRSGAVERLGVEPGAYALVTVHRQSNTTDAAMPALVEVLEALDRPAVFPIHPRTRAALERTGLLRAGGGGGDAHPSARLPRVHRPPDVGGRVPDRLGRGAEGGLPAPRAVHHAARHERVGRDGRAGLEPARGRARRGRGHGRAAGSSRRRPSIRRSTATATPPPASPRLSHPQTSAADSIPAAMTADIAIVGAGYVGLPLAVEFARAGRAVVCIDADTRKVEAIGRGESYIEDVPSPLLAELVAAGTLTATADYAAVADADAILICLPTPLSRNREPDLEILTGATERIARHLRAGQLVVLESTTYPGTTRDVLAPILEAGGLRAGHRLQPGDVARADRPRPHRPHHPHHAEGRGRAHAGLPRAGARPLPRLRRRSSSRSARARRPSSRSCSRTSSARSTSRS